MSVVSIWDEVTVDCVGQNSLGPVSVAHQLHETLLKFLREFVHKSVRVLNKELHLSLVTIWHPMALEAVLVSALLLTHLAIPSQLLKALGLHFVAQPFCWSHLLLRHCTATLVYFSAVTGKWSEYCHSFRSHCAWLTLNRGENQRFLKWLRTYLQEPSQVLIEWVYGSLWWSAVLYKCRAKNAYISLHANSWINPSNIFQPPLERLESKNNTTCGYIIGFTSVTASTDATWTLYQTESMEVCEDAFCPRSIVRCQFPVAWLMHFFILVSGTQWV